MTGLVVDRSEPGVAIVEIVGEHEGYAATRLAERLDELLHERVAIVVDLTRAESLDAGVVAQLVRARADAHEQGGRFAVVMDDSTGWPVRRMFELTGLTAVFPIAESRTAAIAAVHG